MNANQKRDLARIASVIGIGSFLGGITNKIAGPDTKLIPRLCVAVGSVLFGIIAFGEVNERIDKLIPDDIVEVQETTE